MINFSVDNLRSFGLLSDTVREMSGAARVAAAPVMLSRFRGALVGAVLGDCIGGEFEGAVDVPLDRVLQHLSALEDDSRGDGTHTYYIYLSVMVLYPC